MSMRGLKTYVSKNIKCSTIIITVLVGQNLNFSLPNVPQCLMPMKVIIKCALLLSLGALSFFEWNMPLSKPLPLPPPPDPFNKFKARSNLACARLLIGEKKQTSGPASNSRGQQQFPWITQMFIISHLLFCLSQSLEWVKSNRLDFDWQMNANIKCTSRHVTEIKP